MALNFAAARQQIYDAHDEDPTKHPSPDSPQQQEQQQPQPSMAYETHYAQQMELYLTQRCPHASDVLKLAVCGQHFRRWEVPRASFPMTKPGYHAWRTHLKKRQATQVGAILQACGYSEAEVQRCVGLIRKEGLPRAGEDEEVQVLEDVACLVFLDDQFEGFRVKYDGAEEKIVHIVRKTWGKMSVPGRELALKIPMTAECEALVKQALEKAE